MYHLMDTRAIQTNRGKINNLCYILHQYQLCWQLIQCPGILPIICITTELYSCTVVAIVEVQEEPTAYEIPIKSICFKWLRPYASFSIRNWGNSWSLAGRNHKVGSLCVCGFSQNAWLFYALQVLAVSWEVTLPNINMLTIQALFPYETLMVLSPLPFIVLLSFDIVTNLNIFKCKLWIS
jgi:hypothetical protein